MGVTLRCSKTNDFIDLGYGGFLRLRTKVSDLCGQPWACHYRSLVDEHWARRDAAWYETFDRETEKIIQQKRISPKIVDFLLQSDCSGSIRYGACKEILKNIGDYDDNILYGYSGRPDCARFRDFKRLLEMCVENKCRLVWD